MEDSKSEVGEGIEMPEPTAIPFFAAISVAMMGVGLMTSLFISAAGVFILLVTIIYWSRIMNEGVGEMMVPLVSPEYRAKAVERSSRPIAAARPGHPNHRGVFPATVRPYRLGLLAGLVGCGVMAVLSMGWGWLSGHGMWYPVNLLASVVLKDLGRDSIADLSVYSQTGLMVASILHISISLLAGLAFSMLLPTLPWSPVLWGGIVIPLMWSAVVYGALSLFNPQLAPQIAWTWFVVVQVVFGLTVGGLISLGGRMGAKRAEYPRGST